MKLARFFAWLDRELTRRKMMKLARKYETQTRAR